MDFHKQTTVKTIFTVSQKTYILRANYFTKYTLSVSHYVTNVTCGVKENLYDI